MSHAPNVLFISRRFPPSKGGMERYAADLSTALKQQVTLSPVVWTKQNKWLTVLALPILFVQALGKLLTDRSIQVIHSQDAVTAPLAWLLSKLSGKPFVTVIHGLDVTYSNRIYVHTVLPFVRKAKKVIANSTATADAAKARDISKLVVITPGVSEASPLLGHKKTLEQVGLSMLEGKKILLTVGRLVRRKGVAWFIREVLPSIVKSDDSIRYVVVGGGAELESINEAIAATKMDAHVVLLGKVEDDAKLALFGAADIFVMPNIKVTNDMEGFGIVAHEAALARLPLVASNLEGIADAVADGENGLLVTPEDAAAYVAAIEKVLHFSKSERAEFTRKARAYTLKTYDWQKVATKFRNTYEEVVAEKLPRGKTSLKATLAAIVLIITALVVGDYLYTHPHLVDALVHISFGTILGIIAAYTAAFIGLAMILYYSVQLYGKRISLRETSMLNAYSSVTNFFGPGQSGSGIRAVYLKVKHGLRVRSFIFSSLIYYAIYSVISVVMLLAGAGLWLWAAVAALAAVLVSYGVIRLYRRRSKGREGIVNPAALVGILVGTVLQVASLAVVYYLEVTSVHPGITVQQVVSYTGGANMSLFIALTPGAIGIREALLVVVGSLHHIDNNTIVAAGVIDRAVYMIYLGLLFVAVAAMHGWGKLAAFKKS